MKEKLEIKVNGSFIEVSDLIFRSWTGPRRKDGKPYSGKTFYYLSNTEAIGLPRSPNPQEKMFVND